MIHSRPIEQYLDALAQELATAGRARGRILQEIGDHLAEAAEREGAQSASPEEAADRAIQHFGQVSAIAPQLIETDRAGSERRRKRHLQAITTGAVGLVAACFVVFALARGEHDDHLVTEALLAALSVSALLLIELPALARLLPVLPIALSSLWLSLAIALSAEGQGLLCIEMMMGVAAMTIAVRTMRRFGFPLQG